MYLCPKLLVIDFSISCRHTGELVPVRVLETLPIDVLRRNASLPSEVPLLQSSELDRAYSVVLTSHVQDLNYYARIIL